MKPFELNIFPKKEKLAEEVAGFIVTNALEAVRKSGSFIFFLAGGSTPIMVYELLALPEFASKMPWNKTNIFFGDEREVPPNNPKSNFAMAQKAFLKKAAMEKNQIHPMPVVDFPLNQAAQNYEKTLKLFLNKKNPPWDLVMLGLGQDGHTASLFANSPLLKQKTLIGTSRPPKNVSPNLNRLTLTPKAINQAQTVLFTVSGKNKTFPLTKTLSLLKQGRKDPAWPASFIKPQKRLLWYVDTKALPEIDYNMA